MSDIFLIVPWFIAFGAIVVAYFEHKEKIKAGIKPNIDIYTTLGQQEIGKIELKIKNYGPGIARNIKFQFIEGGDFITPSKEKIKDLDIICQGIDSLGPDIEKYFVLTNLPENYVDEKMNVNLVISVIYEDQEGERYTPKPFNIRLKEYHGLRYPPIISIPPHGCSAPTSNTETYYSDPSGNIPPR